MILLNIKLFIIKIIILITNFFKNYTIDFLNFLDTNIIKTCVAILLSSQILILTTTLTNTIINPILKKISFSDENIKNIKYTKFGIEFKIGEFISNLLSFIIVASIIFLIWKLSTVTDYKFINNNLNNIYDNLNYDLINISNSINTDKRIDDINNINIDK